jgi:chromosome partitioning protein
MSRQKGRGTMRTIALISQKGGVGKTTLAIHLATAFVAAGYSTLLLDLDPQASAAEWKGSRAAETPPVMAIPPARLSKVIESSHRSASLRSAPGETKTRGGAAIPFTFIVIRVPSPPPTVNTGREGVSLILAQRGAARAITEQFKLEVSPIRLGDRVAYNRCLIGGQTAQELSQKVRQPRR